MSPSTPAPSAPTSTELNTPVGLDTVSLGRPTVYFDGDCPVCSKEIAYYQKEPGAHEICWVNLATSSADELGADLNKQKALQVMHVRRADGVLLTGAQAFCHIWKSLPRWSWVGRFFEKGPQLWVLERAYRMFLVIRKTWR